MTDTRSMALVLRNQDGDYFILPSDVLERVRVPDEYKGEIERRLAEDAAGYAAQAPGAVVAQVGFFLLAYAATKVLDEVDWGAVLGGSSPQPSRLNQGASSLSRPL